MDAAQRRCIQLIDEMDSELAVVCGPCKYSCKPLIASSEKKECLESVQFLQKKSSPHGSYERCLYRAYNQGLEDERAPLVLP